MLKLDHAFLTRLGLGDLSPERSNRLLKHIYGALEMRVGLRLANQMDQEQLDQFEALCDEGDDAGALRWLETNFPDYKWQVKEEFDRLSSEIAANAEALLAAI